MLAQGMICVYLMYQHVVHIRVRCMSRCVGGNVLKLCTKVHHVSKKDLLCVVGGSYWLLGVMLRRVRALLAWVTCILWHIYVYMPASPRQAEFHSCEAHRKSCCIGATTVPAAQASPIVCEVIY